MNKLAKAALSLALFLLTHAAQANISIGLNGPGTGAVGQSNQMTFDFNYTPLDTSIFENQYWQADYFITDTNLSGQFDLLKDGNWIGDLGSFNFVGYIPALLPTPIPSWVDFDPGKSFSKTIALNWNLSTPGIYEVMFTLVERTNIARTRSAECYADASCKNNLAWEDSERVLNYDSVSTFLNIYPVSPVPEPSAYLLLLSGILVLGATAGFKRVTV